MNIKARIARMILKFSGWIEDYYYVVKIMYNCKKITDTGKAELRLSKAFWWGMDQLASRGAALAFRYPLFKDALLTECQKYTDELLNIKWKIQDEINNETV